MSRVLLPVKRFKQKPAECGLCTIASLANFFDSSIDYNTIRKTVSNTDLNKISRSGMYTSQEARLLNKLGFKKVKIVTADLNLIDFSWAEFDKSELIQRMKVLLSHYKKKKDHHNHLYVKDMIKWLEDERYDNSLVISNDWKKHIERQLNHNVPVGAAINWTSFFKFKKGHHSVNGDITGSSIDHAFVIRGFDDKGVFVVDSHTKSYTGKYRKGFYKIAWDKFLVNVPCGDLILL